MKVKNWIIVALAGALTLSLVAIVAAQDTSTANVEVRVWQNIENPERLFISARPEGGSWQTLGTIPLDMSGLNSRETLRYGDITLAVPVGVPATTTPTPTPDPTPITEEPGIILTLTTTLTREKLVVAYVEPNHTIEEWALQLYLEINGTWVWTSTRTAIEAGEHRALWGKVGRWQDVTRLSLKTLHGTEKRVWDCEYNPTRHDVEVRMECGIGSTETVPDLSMREEATLWVYLKDRTEEYGGYFEKVDAYVRSDRVTLVSPTVRVRYETHAGHQDYCRDSDDELDIGTVETMSCGGFSPTPPYHGPLPVQGLRHVNASDVRAYVPAAGGYVYCQRHQTSHDGQSNWACEPW